jgi:ATP-dependent 26S proteasome regulatory subunit
MKNMDSALIRPGRIDYILHFDYVVKEQVMEIYRKFTQCDDEKKINKFYEEFCELNIKTSACLLQQYLLQYIDEPDKAIEHLDDMKIMYNRANISPKVTEETGLYN